LKLHGLEHRIAIVIFANDAVAELGYISDGCSTHLRKRFNASSRVMIASSTISPALI
jgi:hypothetical protein